VGAARSIRVTPDDNPCKIRRHDRPLISRLDRIGARARAAVGERAKRAAASSRRARHCACACRAVPCCRCRVREKGRCLPGRGRARARRVPGPRARSPAGRPARLAGRPSFFAWKQLKRRAGWRLRRRSAHAPPPRRADSPCLLQIPLPDPGLGTGCRPSLAPLPLPATCGGGGVGVGGSRQGTLALVWQSVPAPVPRGFGCRASCSGTYVSCPPLVWEGTGGSSGNLFWRRGVYPRTNAHFTSGKKPCSLSGLCFFFLKRLV
jgi:hypothetical protein